MRALSILEYFNALKVTSISNIICVYIQVLKVSLVNCPMREKSAIRSIKPRLILQDMLTRADSYNHTESAISGDESTTTEDDDTCLRSCGITIFSPYIRLMSADTTKKM